MHQSPSNDPTGGPRRPTGRRPPRPAFFWIVLAFCPIYVGCFAFSVSVASRAFGITKAPGWMVRATRAGWFVSAVDADGPAGGHIETGDRLLAINGDDRAAILGPSYWRAVRAGDTYRVDLERRGEHVVLSLPMPLGAGSYFDFVTFVMCAAFFVCGAALGLLRPRDPQVRLVAGCMMLCGFSFLSGALVSGRGFLVGAEAAVFFALVTPSPWIYPLAYHLFSRFPTWRSPGPFARAIQWLLYLLVLLVFWPAWSLHYLGVDVGGRTTRFLVEHPTLYLTGVTINAGAGWAFFLLCLVLAMVVTARNYRDLRDAGSRRRIRWVVAGLMIALIPFTATTFAYRFTGSISEHAYRRYVGGIAFLPMIAIPISIAAAVRRQQLFDIGVLVRRGLQSLLARAALRTLLALPVAFLLLSIVSNPNRTVAQILMQGSGWVNIVWIGAIAAALQSRQRLQTALDRRFFREAYEQEQVLTQLMDEVRQRDSLAEIARLVSLRIDSVLHPTSVHIFYRAGERSDRFESHSSSASASGEQLSQQQVLLRTLGGGPALRDVTPEAKDRLPPSERQWLDALGVRLIVPITGTADRLVGVLFLGERMSDEPYSATDRRLLQGIAAQIGLVYENEHLKERVRRDADVRRDVLARLDERSVSLLKECPTCGRCYDSVVERGERDASELALTLQIARTLDGKYRLDRAIGRGGFGAVFEASDLRLQRQVAAKVMMGSLFGDRDAIRRFEREARAAARIDHRNITRVHDYGAVGSGGAYLIMELVTGRTWRAALQRTGAIAPLRASGWFRQLLDGVRFAHSLGIVHRDLKPENVMIVDATAGDELKIMDFGLAKVADGGTGATETVTAAGMMMGTLGYMSPEMLTGGVVDERADLFAIGVMLAETLTGVRPFRGQTPQEILTVVLRTEYHLPGDSADIRALDAVLQRCLAKDPRDRYGSAGELAIDLVPMLASFRGFDAVARADKPDAPTRGDFTA
jgi:GAF domain-containing protein